MVESASFDNPEGFKGVGESATIPVPAAIAVEGALRKRGVKAALTEIPLTPERVLNLIRG